MTPRTQGHRSMRFRPLSVLTLTLAALAAAPSIDAQVPHLAAGEGLGEGSRQPEDAPFPIPHASPRPRASSPRRRASQEAA